MMLLITRSLLSGKELAEEKNLIINGIIPVFSIVFTGTGNKIMIYLAAQQPIVKVFVHIQKKIILTAIYNKARSPILNLIELIDYRMFVPYSFI